MSCVLLYPFPDCKDVLLAKFETPLVLSILLVIVTCANMPLDFNVPNNPNEDFEDHRKHDRVVKTPMPSSIQEYLSCLEGSLDAARFAFMRDKGGSVSKHEGLGKPCCT